MFKLPEKIQKQANIQMLLGITNSQWLYYGFTAIILGISYFWFFSITTELEVTQQQILKSNKNVIAYQNDIITKQQNLEKLKQEYDLYDQKYSQRIRRALPEGEQIEELTRFLEKFALQLTKKGDFVMNAVSYGPAKNEGKYFSLPIRLTFQANTGNFAKFMELIDRQSGSLEEKEFEFGEPVRAMQVDRINLSFPEYNLEAPPDEFVYNVNLQLSAFFTNPPSTPTNKKK
ncbi:type 4a pilus biogenesis protein PilO [Candidatus Peregrinibacteria bacterium]|nr:MAG: type 4a pilus biogenesis protein PilO [Candidatus Peregrinibacteria bacterium]